MSLAGLRNRPTPEWVEQLRAKYPVERRVDAALTRKLLRRAGGAAAASSLREIGERLQAFLARRIEGPFQVRNLAALTGGASKEQFVFEIDWTCAGERRLGERMVLRREPAESVVESDRLREFQILKAVAALVPVPATYWLDESGEELGRPGLVYGFVEGVQKPVTSTTNVTGVGIEFDAEHRAVLGPQVVDCLARIHRFDGNAPGLSAFDLPQAGTTQDIDWQLNWWARVWQEDQYEEVPLMTLAEQWLRANRRPLDRVSLVHSDYRTGNYLFHPVSKRITAVLDWELSYFGDRHYDLAWLLMPIFITPDENKVPRYASLFDRRAFIADYEAASGLKIDEERLRYCSILALWKGTVMTLGSALRAAGGLRSHQDVVLSWFSGLSYPLLEALRQALCEVREGVPALCAAGT